MTPGMDIEIKSPDFISTMDKTANIVFVPLAWNFYREIREKIKSYRNVDTDIFVRYFPNLIIEK